MLSTQALASLAVIAAVLALAYFGGRKAAPAPAGKTAAGAVRRWGLSLPIILVIAVSFALIWRADFGGVGSPGSGGSRPMPDAEINDRDRKSAELPPDTKPRPAESGPTAPNPTAPSPSPPESVRPEPVSPPTTRGLSPPAQPSSPSTASAPPPRAMPPTAAGEPSPGPAPGAGAGSPPTTTPAAPDPQPSPPAAAPPPPPPAAAEETGKFSVVPVFFGTDRERRPGTARIEYGAERGRRLEIGRALVSVPASHDVPNIERPWALRIPYFDVKVYEEKEDPEKHFTLRELKSLTREELAALVAERLSKSKAFEKHALIFVHGFNTSFDNAVYRTAQIANDLKFDGAPFLYSWPSGGAVASYTYDRESAGQSEPYMRDFLSLVVKQPETKAISVIAHSMGSQLLLPVLRDLKASAPGVVIHQVILAAPDVDRDNFENLAREIKGLAKGITLYAAANDRALGVSRRFHGGVPRAGDVPPSGPVVTEGIDTIDVTAVSTDSLGLNHSGYAENNALLSDIKLLLQTGERPPDKRVPILTKIWTAKGDYWRYPK